MAIDKICKMTIKGVKLKSESFFLISYGLLELWLKNPKGGGGGFHPPSLDRVKVNLFTFLRVRTSRGKPGKRDFLKKSGKPGKLREFSDHFYNLRENSRNFQFCQISLIKQVVLSE